MGNHVVAGRYSLEREIGRGGSGAVWLARDEVLLRDVAVKRVGLPSGAVEEEVAQADREARLAAQVTHPNVVAVLDFVDDGAEHWLVMEYVDGTNLARLVRDHGPLSPTRAALVIGHAADGLAAAHELGIVHRDVKPSNILVGDAGEVKLTDFGIARGISDATLTRTGVVTGSPAYLSPEVATGGSATAASDVWSLGATLFHCLAGQPPYHIGDGGQRNALATLNRVAHSPPPRLRTEPWLESVLEATMARDPRRRPSADDVAGYLAAHAQDTGAGAHPPLRAPKADRGSDGRRLGLVGGMLVVVLAVIGGLLLLTGGDGDRVEGTSGTATATRTVEPSDGSSGSAQEPARTDDADDAAPSAAELEEFARSYVSTASSDPDRGIRMLTSDYRAASPAYHQFWRSVSNPRILRVAADPANLRVSYTYRYRLPGVGERTEDVVLQLVEQDGTLLISGAS
jgi:eukaryotic-like serine/threonine-protein kinase